MGVRIGTLHVRRSIFIQARPEAVWEEFGSFDRLSRWLGLGHTLHALELVVGGGVDMSVPIDGKERHYGGKVLVVEPGRELSFESNWQAPHAWPVPTVWTLRLTPLYEGTGGRSPRSSPSDSRRCSTRARSSSSTTASSGWGPMRRTRWRATSRAGT